MKRRYKERSHISDKKIREVVYYFSLDFTTTNTSKLTNISRPTINKYFDRFRKIIFLESEQV
jgi:transposase